MNIRVDLTTPIYDGTEVVFRSPVDCSQITGLIVYYNGGSKEFTFADAHGNDVGNIDHLFGENVVVKVILDVTRGMAFVQNADTNSYLEERFANMGGGKVPLVQFDLTHNMLNVAGDMVLPDNTPWNFNKNPVDAEHSPGLFTTLDQVHALYDDLVEKYPHLWSKRDAAEVMSSVWYKVLYNPDNPENEKYQTTETQVEFETSQIIDGALTTDGRSVYQYKTKDGEEGYCCFEDVYPTYANGIQMSKNLFDRDKVLFDFLYEKEYINGKEVSRKRPGTKIYMDWLSGQVDIITGESAPGHTISESNRKKMMLLKAGVYVLSYGYELKSGDSCTLRVAYVNRTDEGEYLNSYTLTSGTTIGDETKRWYAFKLPYDSYCTIMRSTINVKATIYDIMLEKMDVDSIDKVTAPSPYEHYGQVAYKYSLSDDVVCNGIYPADVTDDELQKDGLTVANLRIHSYKPTPEYKTYLYKFSFENESMHSKPGLVNAKKTIFLTSSVNGDEKTAPFNSYLFCKRLCEVFAEKTEDGDYYYDDDYFKFAQAFDVYIVPCINGYGQYHNLRWNANGVQIDRNFDTGYWVAPDRKNGGVTFVPETLDYPGIAPDSEFETLLIEKLTEKIKPDMAIDLHNYTSTLPRQFYTGVAKREWMPLLYQSCADCSIAFKRKYPQYFGTSIDLVRDARDYRLEYAATNGEVTTWWRTKGNVYFPSLIEVCQTINYNNGELVGTYDDKGEYKSTSTAGLDLQGADTFSVAEYTVRNQLVRFGQFVLENKV